MDFENAFPIWDKINEQERLLLKKNAVKRDFPKGSLINTGSSDCLGLFVICSGQLRAFIISEEGKEITIYRLFERDICLFSASCIMRNIQFEITIEAEKDSELWLIPSDTYKKLMDSSLPVSNYTNQIMASRFSEVIWLMEQIMWKSFDRRLASFLIEESNLDGSDQLRITHDKIASHMGTAREVVTRMLRYFQSEGMVSLTRGIIQLTDREKLLKLAE